MIRRYAGTPYGMRNEMRYVSASSALTRQRFGWQPVQFSLLADLDEGHYFAH